MQAPLILTIVSMAAVLASSCGKLKKNDEDFVIRAPYTKPTAQELKDYEGERGFNLMGSTSNRCKAMKAFVNEYHKQKLEGLQLS